jgi:hypothetical protein
VQQAPSTPRTGLPKAAQNASSSTLLLNLTEGSLLFVSEPSLL